MLPEGAHGAPKVDPKVPKRNPRGPKNDQRAPTSFQKCVREASLEAARKSNTWSEKKSFQRVKTFKRVELSSISTFRASVEKAHILRGFWAV